MKLVDDPTWTVRRQLAATIGELPQPGRVDAAVRMLTSYGTDPVTVDATISGLKGSEGDVLTRAFTAGSDVIAVLAGAVARSADAVAVQQILVRIGDPATDAAQRTALLNGLDLGLPGAGGGRGGRGLAGRGAAQPVRVVTLTSEPADLVKRAAAEDEGGAIAKRVVAKLDWPGKPAPVAASASPLTAEQQKRFDAGSEIYRSICLGCHQADGKGKEKIAPSLVESRYVIGPDPGAATRILLAGKEGAIGLMPPLGFALNDEQIASVLTYVRREWGHTASAVAPDDVREIRGLTKMRTRPWTDPELQTGRGGRGAGRGGQ
jgi:cytochrome c553